MDKEKIKRRIREVNAKQWGGYFMHSLMGLVTRYLPDEWMELVSACAGKACQA